MRARNPHSVLSLQRHLTGGVRSLCCKVVAAVRACCVPYASCVATRKYESDAPRIILAHAPREGGHGVWLFAAQPAHSDLKPA